MEATEALPEIIVLGDRTVYQVRYDGDGVVCGAKLLTDPEVAVRCRTELTALWRQGEELSSFLAKTEALTGSRDIL